MVETLNDLELFAASWLLFLDCSLEESELAMLWRMPRYGSRKPVHKGMFESHQLKTSQVIGHVDIVPDAGSDQKHVILYQLNRMALNAKAFMQVVREAGNIAASYTQVSLIEFLKNHAFDSRRPQWGIPDYIRDLNDRIRLYSDGLRHFGGLAEAGYSWVYASYGRRDNPTGDGDTMRNPRKSSIVRQVAWAERDAIRKGITVFSRADQNELLKYILAEGFRLNEEVDWAYNRIMSDFSNEELREYGLYRLAAYAFWRGEPNLLKEIGNHPALLDSRSSGFLKALENGDNLVAAQTIATRWSMAKNLVGNYSVRDLPVIMFVLFASMISQHGITLTKRIMAILKYFSGYQQGGACQNFEQIFDSTYLDLVLNRLQGEKFSVSYGHGAGFDSDALPIMGLLPAAMMIKGGLGAFGEGDSLGLGEVQMLAEIAQEGGYLTIAATFYSLACSAFDQSADSACGQALKALGERGVRPFSGVAKGEDDWEAVLEAFAKAVKPTKKRKAKNTSAGVFHWVITIANRYASLEVDSIDAAFSPRSARGDSYNEPQVIPVKRLLAGEFDAMMSAQDLEIKKQLVTDGVIVGSGAYNRRIPKKQHVIALCGHENLLLSRVSWDRSHWREKLERMTLMARESRIAFDADANGIRLKVSAKAYNNVNSYRLSEGEKNQFTVEYCSEEFEKLATIIRQKAVGNVLHIPSAGVEKFDKWINGIDRALPFEAATGSKGSKMTTAALCEPLLRLKYADGVLDIHLVIRISREPDLVVEPVAGLEQKPVVDAKGNRSILKRDFAAEGKAIVPAREVLAPYEASRTEKNRWSFEDAEESLDVLSAIKVAAEAKAFELEWPDGNVLSLASLTPHGATFKGGETADYWLSVEGSFNLDDGKVLSFVDLIKNFDSREGAYVKLTDSRYLRLTTSLARRIESLKGAGVIRGDKLLISPAALPSLEKSSREVEADAVLPLPEIVKERIDRIRNAFSEGIRQPATLKCQMRPYQVEGYEWLSRLCKCGIGACLADDMGLGKTVQLIALILRERKNGTSLVIAPASVVFNWRSEIERFAPTLRVNTIGQNPNADEEDLKSIARQNDVLITSYGVLTSREEKFVEINWNVVVLDEAQAIKNHLTQRAKSVRQLKAKFRVVATGTPIENRLSELWSLFDFINPGMLGGETYFAKTYTVRGEATPRLKRLVKPLILRRLKREVLTDLPEKQEITLSVLLGDEERHAYEAVRQHALDKLKASDPKDKLAILAELTRLRRFCCHPSLVMPELMVSAKLDALDELLENLRSSHHRALVFSQFVDYLGIVRKRLDAHGWNYKYLDGSTSKTERERSVEAFQAGDGDFFLISLKAGGTGLNLTAANYVILLDPWWNPAVENQAADRVHRIGQHLPVTVYRLIAKGTIEEKVVNLHAKKLALAEDVLAGGTASLSAEAMLSLLEG